MPQQHLGLFDTPPERKHVALGVAAVAAMAAAVLIALPVRNVRAGEVTAFIPMIDTAMFLGEITTAILLYSQAALFRSRALAALATGYAFTALLVVPHLLTFPGAFAPHGLFGGVNTTGWIALLRRPGFPVSVILYVFLRPSDAAAGPGTGPRAGVVAGWLSAVALAAAVTLVATGADGLLPQYFSNRTDLVYRAAVGYQVVFFLPFVAAAIVLFRARRSALDLWLLVALASWMIELLLTITVRARFTVGFYLLFVMEMFSDFFVLLALLAEANRLYARLAVSTAALNRQREARLMSIEAATAAISHEVGQPLTALRMHATAGLKSLDRRRPDIDRAINSLRAALDAGRRTSDVIRSVRQMFAPSGAAPEDFSLNDLVCATVRLLETEIAYAKISLQLELDEDLQPVRANRTQIERVLVNLLLNAVEALDGTRDRPRQITIRTSRLHDDDVLLEVSDNGPGVAPEQAAQIFEPFFTTKGGGTGLGLSLCQWIAEAHGGRLWVSPAADSGATFCLQLPRRALLAA